MKYIAYVIIPLILISSYGGCSDECNNCAVFPPNCTFLEEINESECLIEALINSCESFSCSSLTYRFSLNSPSCEIIDCTTLTCDASSIIPTDDPNIFMSIKQPGTITLLGLDEFNFPFGLVEVDDVIAGNVQEEFDCFFVSP